MTDNLPKYIDVSLINVNLLLGYIKYSVLSGGSVCLVEA